VVITININ